MRRFYLEDIEKEVVELAGSEFRHLKDVLRLAVGSKVILFNGKGYDFFGMVEALGKKSAKIRIEEVKGNLSESPFDITLLQALIKGDRPEWILQKSTELGVKEVIFFTAARTVPQVEVSKRLLRLRRVAIEALKQSGRGVLPKIGLVDFYDAIRSQDDKKLKIVFYEGEKTRGIKDAAARYGGSAVVVLVGPEGGFKEEEVLEAQKQGFIPVKLGPRILRAETAAIAAVSIIQHVLGDIG